MPSTNQETHLVQHIKPIRMQIRLQNNLIKQRREVLRLSTHEMAEKIGISYQAYIQLENMRSSPKGKKIEWLSVAVKVATYFHVLPEDLFPEVITSVKDPTTETVLDTEEIHALLSANYMQALNPEEALEQKQLGPAIDKVLKVLPFRERIIMKGRLGLSSDGEVKTYDELGKMLKVHPERIRQIESRARRSVARDLVELIRPGTCTCIRSRRTLCPVHQPSKIDRPL